MRRLLLLSAVTVLMAGAFIPFGGAQAVSLLNGSFEDGINPGLFTSLSAGSTNIENWTITAGSVDYIGTYWTAADGFRSLDMNGVSAGSISQTITGLTDGQLYRVSFKIAGNPDAEPTIKTLGVTASAEGNSYTFDTTGKSHGAMGWVTKDFLFTADGTTAVLSFTSATGGGFPAYGPALDDISVSAVPLPAALPLFAAGLGVMGLLGWRRKRKAPTAIAAA